MKLSTHKMIAFLLMGYIASVSAAQTWTNAEIDLVFGGYPDSSIAFLPVGGTINPANCPGTQVYVMPGNHDTSAAMSILLSAKMTGKRVYFSVRHDICHVPEQVENSKAFPVIQRVAVR